jgi:hypothetical protein
VQVDLEQACHGSDVTVRLEAKRIIADGSDDAVLVEHESKAPAAATTQRAVAPTQKRQDPNAGDTLRKFLACPPADGATNRRCADFRRASNAYF